MRKLTPTQGLIYLAESQVEKWFDLRSVRAPSG